jgi:DNA/RNA-binding domain of Phe-tRNA-synthetase-like protein
MELHVDPEVFARFPGMRIVGVVADGIDNSKERSAVEAAWRSAWEGAATATQYGNAQSHPRVAPWRSYFRAMGVSPKEFPSSIEALLRRAMKGGEPFRINALVDAYNTVSLRHVVPAGGFDLAAVAGALELRLTRDGDTFTSLDASGPLAVPTGEVAYVTGSTVLTRHFVWRQSREALITPETRHVVLLAEVLDEAGGETATLVVDDLTSILSDVFAVPATPFEVRANAPSARADPPGHL